MHILEIISVDHRPTKRYSGEFRDQVDDDYEDEDTLTTDKKRIGSGAFATVKKSKDPHTVIKYSRDFHEEEEDGYWGYANYIIKHNLWENPYFPRIYAKQKYVDSEQRELKKYELERLDSTKNLLPKDWEFLIRKMFGENTDILDKSTFSAIMNAPNKYLSMGNLVARIIGKEIRPVQSSQTIKWPIGTIEHSILRSKEVRLKYEISDPLLDDAIQQIKQMQPKVGNPRIDLHAGNLMARRGKTGVQLVITDPFAERRT